ncbi:MAG: PorT family protein [Saprospiraceae bacterium]|nr:PorT family protein [Saprospiraceae bacterium]
MLRKLTVAVLLMAGILSAQGQEQGGGIKFGVHLDPTLSFMGSNDNRVKSAGSNIGIGVGVELEYYFSKTENFAFTFGADFAAGRGGKMLYRYGGYLLPNSDQDFDFSSFSNNSFGAAVQPDLATVGGDTSGLDFAAYNSIRYNVNYIEIPFGLKLRTNELGESYLRAFFHIPVVKIKIPISARARFFPEDTGVENFEDDVLGYTVDSEVAESIYSDIFPLQVSAGLGAGVEWSPNEDGGLRIFGGIYYEADILDMTRKIQTRDAITAVNTPSNFAPTSYTEIIDEVNDDADLTYSLTDRNPRMAPHNISLRIGILFAP